MQQVLGVSAVGQGGESWKQFRVPPAELFRANKIVEKLRTVFGKSRRVHVTAPSEFAGVPATSSIRGFQDSVPGGETVGSPPPRELSHQVWLKLYKA